MIGRHTPRRQAGGKLAQKCRRAAQIESAVMRNPDRVECRNSEVPGGVEIHALLVGRSWPAVLDVTVAVLQFSQQRLRLLGERVVLTIARAAPAGTYTKNHNEMMPANRRSTAVINIASCIGLLAPS